ncbi:hypothetical protein LEP1GSC047_3974 [Leptospira inadai serovar Lyme str. 10]|uniref:Uncharacterized protein n=1 Tax=Leptospira inadai serovar Lyme str. 10 TaxID=1049790 RepID=V6HXX1_9LEPT|nr:hypothetical protein LEP1GSC047_3974 [Leptospira inadai serovar Lyme str. 10]
MRTGDLSCPLSVPIKKMYRQKIRTLLEGTLWIPEIWK